MKLENFWWMAIVMWVVSGAISLCVLIGIIWIACKIAKAVFNL